MVDFIDTHRLRATVVFLVGIRPGEAERTVITLPVMTSIKVEEEALIGYGPIRSLKNKSLKRRSQRGIINFARLLVPLLIPLGTFGMLGSCLEGSGVIGAAVVDDEGTEISSLVVSTVLSFAVRALCTEEEVRDRRTFFLVHVLIVKNGI